MQPYEAQRSEPPLDMQPFEAPPPELYDEAQQLPLVQPYDAQRSEHPLAVQPFEAQTRSSLAAALMAGASSERPSCASCP